MEYFLPWRPPWWDFQYELGFEVYTSAFRASAAVVMPTSMTRAPVMAKLNHVEPRTVELWSMIYVSDCFSARNDAML